MGRPMFSAVQTPAVRAETELEPAYPQYEKWTYLKPFDPDADEFFESDDAVFEAFIDPAHALPHHAPTAERVLTYLAEISATDSSASSSGRGTPATPSRSGTPPPPDASSREEGSASVWRSIPVEDRRDVSPGTDLPNPLPNPAERVWQPGEMVSAYANMYSLVSASRRTPPPAPRMAARQPTFIRYPSEEDTRPITPPPAPMWSPGPATLPRRPFTPPNMAQTPGATRSPSPPPSVTPRIYSSSALNPAYSNPPQSPLSSTHTIRATRRPTAHIASAPQLVPVSRLVG